MSQLERMLDNCEQRINFVLAHPSMSNWLKDALRSAADRNPIDLLNELELLASILRPRCEVLIALEQVGLSQSPQDEPGAAVASVASV